MKHLKKFTTLALGAVIGISCFAGLVGCGDTENDNPGGTGENGIVMNDTFYNPLRVESELGDPWMYTKDGYYYVTYSEGTQITLTRSKWMTNMTANNADETRTKVFTRQKTMNLVEILSP